MTARRSRHLATLDPVEVGDHVCWVTGPDEDFAGTARAFAADGALFGDKVLVIGSPEARWAPGGTARGVLVDPAAERPGWDAEAMLGLLRREADTACRQGFRALRVLARMDRVWPEGASPQEIARHELGLDSLVAGGAALVVCAYHRDAFRPGALEQAGAVHPQRLGGHRTPPAFRLFSVAPGCWGVSGVVDSEGAEAFRTALGELFARSATVRLRCEETEFMDAAGMRALAEATRAVPGRRVLLEHANETVRRCWTLLGYDHPLIPVELTP
ncbi:MEDS domain-containing protein [Kitasatospora sp. NPDC096147]|uniref:MEDS domain-containing protein n=1 Tax=Kitasatospora sp. NPDC096147 TaxID=3364093 RepID=UPI0038075315